MGAGRYPFLHFVNSEPQKFIWELTTVALRRTHTTDSWIQPSSFRLYRLYSTHDFLSTYLACCLGIVSMGEGIYLLYLCGLLSSAAFQGWSMQSYPSQPFWVNRCWLDEWKFVTTSGENNSRCWVSHQGHLCAWRTVYYVEGRNQGINWNGIEAWMELGSLSFRDIAHVFLFTWWLRSKFPDCEHRQCLLRSSDHDLGLLSWLQAFHLLFFLPAQL